MYRKFFYINSLLGYAFLVALLLSGCHEQVSPETIAILTASHNSVMRSNDDLDGSCRRLVRMLRADKQNHPEEMEKLLSMDSLVNAHVNTLDTMLIKLIEEVHYSEKQPGEYVSNGFMKKMENGELLKPQLSILKNLVGGFTAKFPLPDTIPIDIDLVHGRPAYIDLFSRHVSKIEAVTMLAVLRNNIKSTREMLLKRFVKEIYEEDWLMADELFVNCNYSHFKIGDTLKASFGRGEIARMDMCDVYIDGKLVRPIKQKILRPTVPLGAKDPTIQIESVNTVYSEIVRKPGRYVRSVLVQIPTRSGGINVIRDSLVYTVEP